VVDAHGEVQAFDRQLEGSFDAIRRQLAIMDSPQEIAAAPSGPRRPAAEMADIRV
jgi:hypothetical protein